jgi:hypothetical protein
VSTETIGAAVSVSPRAGWHRRRPVVITAVAVIAVGAFLLWGPIGLGNGPVNAGIGATEFGTDLAGGPMGFALPIRNTGGAPAVIDGVELISGTDYAGPQVLGLRVITSEMCGGAWPTHQTARDWAMPGVCGTDQGPLIGGAVSHNPGGFPAAAEVAAPHPGTCWVVTKIVVHYHVGIRYYSATDPYRIAVCSNASLVNAAKDAMDAASG